MRVQISEAAELDISESFAWYRERSPRAAQGFRAEVVAAIDLIATNPKAWAADEDDNRRLVLVRFPFSVVYELVPGAVHVLAVAHHRKRPGYWRTQR